MEDIVFDEIIHDLHTINDMIRWVVSYFRSSKIFYGHGNDNPLDEAIQLIFTTLNLPPDIPNNLLNSRLTYKEKINIIKNSMLRVNQRIPVSYITNISWFCGHEFYVNRNVLIPRSPISELINNNFNGLIGSIEPTSILDMCTGSGCIAISCAYIFSKSKIDAVDISRKVLEVAKINIVKHGLCENIKTIQSDLFNQITGKKYDLIISNPPYVKELIIKNLPEEYLHEPELGLLGGIDGLKFIYRILANAANFLNNNGILICEVGDRMQKLIKIFVKVPFTWLEFENVDFGVFKLTYQELMEYHNYFSTYKK